MEFSHIDAFDNSISGVKSRNTAIIRKPRSREMFHSQDPHQEDDLQEPRQLESGRWACNHKCKNKKT